MSQTLLENKKIGDQTIIYENNPFSHYNLTSPIAAWNKSGRWLIQAVTKSPPFDPPLIANLLKLIQLKEKLKP